MGALEDVGIGFFLGLVYGTAYSIPVILVSMIYRYLADEKFPILMAVVLGVGLMGFAGGLSTLAAPGSLSLSQLTEIGTGSFLIIWIVNMSDRLLTKFPKNSHLFGMGRHEYRTVKLPDAPSLRDILSKPKVPEQMKRELAGMELLMPSDLPIDELTNRVKRRIITDWGVGDVELEMDAHGKITYLALAGRDQGISPSVREGTVALPLKFERAPAGLGPGDLVTIYLKNGEAIDSTEVIGIDQAKEIVTVLINLRSLEKYKDQEAAFIVALPTFKQMPLVKDIMTAPPQMVPTTDSAKRVLELIGSQKPSSVIVFDADKAVGIVTRKDLVERAFAKELKLASVQAKDVMTAPVVSISPEATFAEAIDLMKTKGLEQLPVFDAGKPVGMISISELLKAGVTLPTRWTLRGKKQSSS